MLSDYWRQKCSFSTLTFSTFLPPPLVHLSSRGCPFEKKKYWDCCRYRCRRKKLLHKISQVFPNIRKYISISHFFIHRKILHGWSSLWDNRTRKRLQRRPERETRQSFVLTLLVEPLPKTIILPPARDYSSHLRLRNKTTWGVHRSRGPPQVIVV